MILKKLKLCNFRGYKNFEISFDENMNVIIGRNDVGKSTILEALEIFFNSERLKLEKSDLCVFADSDTISISCCFDVGDGEIILDTIPTKCKDEYILNEDGYLEVKKIWNCSGENITKSSLKTFLVANYPNSYETPLLLEKISELQKKYDAYKNDPIYIPEKRTISAELRKAIYSKELIPPIRFHLIDIDISKEGGKEIWSPISKQLPQYFLFQSDRKNTDKDDEIQNPLKEIAKSILLDMNEEIEQLQNKVKTSVEKIGERTLEKLKEFDSSIANDIRPVVTLKPLDSSFVFDLKSDNGIPLNKRGSGIRRLILLSYFRADAEESIIQDMDRQVIYAIEEPETSQHPDFQRMILDTLEELSVKPTHQIIMTSHTPEIAKLVNLEQLIFLKKLPDGTIFSVVDESEKARGISKTLGVLPYAETQTIIYLEGKNDVSFITNINQQIDELKSIIDLNEEDISLIPLQGGNLISWINKDYFEKSNIREIYIVDNDVPKYKNLITEINEKNDKRRYGWTTNRNEMENYLPCKLIESEFDVDLSMYKDSWYEIDVPKLLVNLCMKEICCLQKREIVIKERLNSKLSKRLSKKVLEEIDAWEEIENWFKKIKGIHEGTYIHKP